MKPNVCFLKTNNNVYLYDGNTGYIMMIDFLVKDIIENYWDNSNDEIISQLKDRFSVDNIEQALEKIEEAKSRGLLTPFPKKISLDGIINELHYDLENNISGVCLSITQNCNLRCEYCIYSGIYSSGRTHSDKTMSFEIAKKAIDYAICRSSAQPQFMLSFYGGEPLLRFDLIKQCIEYTINEYHGKKLGFNMTTNGTLLNEHYIDYLAKNNVLLHISLDGPKEYHDEYRKFAISHKGSFETIKKNILDIKKRYPKYYKDCISFGVTLSPYRNIQKIEDFLLEGEIIDAENYTRISRVNQGEALSIYDAKRNEENIVDNIVRERFIDVRYIHSRIHDNNDYLEKSKVPIQLNDFIDEFHGRRVIKISSEEILPSGCCSPGQNKLYVSVDGDFYICEKCDEDSELLKIGSISTGINVKKAEKIVESFYSCTEKECLRCWAYIWCYICPVQIEKNEELSRKEKLRRCENVRLSIKRDLSYYLTILEKNPYAFSR